METFYNLFFAARTLRLDVILLALIAGAAVFMLFYGMVSTNKGKATSNKTLVAVQHAASRSSQRELSGVQARLDKANLDMKAGEYVRRSLMLGIPLGIGLFILVGAIVLSAVGVLAGFMFTWTRLEQERDKKQIRYSKQLASSCDTIRTSYGVNPSLKRALEAGAEFSQDDLKVDFQELVTITPEAFEQLKVIASLDSPFAEALLARFSRYVGRLGTPDIDRTLVLSRLEHLRSKPVTPAPETQ